MVQLPRKLRSFNHEIIGKLKSTPSLMLLPELGILGFVVSVGEFFCTGQLYVASIVTLVGKNDYDLLVILMMLIIYILAMCLPLLIMVLIVWKTKKLLAVSRFALNKVPTVKFIYAVVYGILFWALLFF